LDGRTHQLRQRRPAPALPQKERRKEKRINFASEKGEKIAVVPQTCSNYDTKKQQTTPTFTFTSLFTLDFGQRLAKKGAEQSRQYLFHNESKKAATDNSIASPIFLLYGPPIRKPAPNPQPHMYSHHVVVSLYDDDDDYVLCDESSLGFDTRDARYELTSDGRMRSQFSER